MKKKLLRFLVLLAKMDHSCRIFTEKNYEVHGIKRKSSSFNTERIDHIYVDPHLGSNLYLQIW